MASSPPVSFAAEILLICPPWLRRRVGGALMAALGEAVDVATQRAVDGVALRFPSAAQPRALTYLGRQRQILRGPGEDGATFAARMLTWWDAHRTRGGPYALLGQLHAFFVSSLAVPIALVANSGFRHQVDVAGAITEDTISWGGDGEHPARWARLFLFFSLSGTTVGIPLLAEVSIYAMSDAERELFCAVPREWSAAHIDLIYLTLLPPEGDVWGYPPGGTWADDDPSPGQVWGGNLAVQFVC